MTEKEEKKEKKLLKVLRVEADLTQKQVADKLGISPSTWSKWESGKSYPYVNDIETIEKLLNLGHADI